jgi:RNA polymerase sigma-70 factor (ECF subfamily)
MEPTDIELMLRVRDDDVAAFRELLRRYREPLHRFFTAIFADRSQVDDFIQETFLRLWLNRHRYEPTGKFSAYLYQIGRHHWFNQRKKLRPELGEEALDQVRLVVGPDRFEPETMLLERDRHARVRRAIEELPEHSRVVFELSHFEELKYAEIARQLGIPVGTVKSRMAGAVRRLRRALADEDGRG